MFSSSLTCDDFTMQTFNCYAISPGALRLCPALIMFIPARLRQQWPGSVTKYWKQ